MISTLKTSIIAVRFGTVVRNGMGCRASRDRCGQSCLSSVNETTRRIVYDYIKELYSYDHTVLQNVNQSDGSAEDLQWW